MLLDRVRELTKKWKVDIITNKLDGSLRTPRTINVTETVACKD